MRMISAFLALIAVSASAHGAPARMPDPVPPPAAPEGVSGEALLPPLVEHSKKTARIENGRLVGDGADFLRELGEGAQFVMIGEDHGSAGIAKFVEAYWRDLNERGFDHLAVETDPFVAAKMERMLREEGLDAWATFLADNGGWRAAPFFSWRSEAELALAAATAERKSDAPAIWGLDQVFIGSAPWLLDGVARTAKRAAARELARKLADEARADPLGWLGETDGEGLKRLRSLLPATGKDDNARLIDAMIESSAIYRPFVNGEGEVYLANAARERLMKRRFLDYHDAAKRGGRKPKVLMKFGAWHAYRGATPSRVQGLGGFVSEFAVAEGGEALAILAVCGPNGFVVLDGPDIPCTEWFDGHWASIAPFTERDGLTIFDLREWRLRPGRWSHLPEDIRRQIDSFDLLVVVAATPAADRLPGLDDAAASSSEQEE